MTERTRHIALLVDLDNGQIAAEKLGLHHCAASQVWPGALVQLVERALGGRVIIRRAYGDAMLHSRRIFREKVWQSQALRQVIAVDQEVHRCLATTGFQFMHTSPIAELKNAADIHLSLDALELATTATAVDTFAILSADSDFSPLVRKLRALGRDVAVITVGRPKHQGMAALLSMCTGHVVYDQEAVDAAAFDPLCEILTELAASPAEPLRTGVRTALIQRRLQERVPGFQPRDLGFERFGDLLDACIEAPLRREEHIVRLEAPAPEPEVIDERDRTLAAALRRLGMRPRPELVREVLAWLKDRTEAPKFEKPTVGDLTREIVEVFLPRGASKSATRDVFSALLAAGAVRLGGGSDAGTVGAEVLGVERDSIPRLAAEAVRRLDGAGIPLSMDDAENLSRVLVGRADEDVRQGVVAGLMAGAPSK